MRSGGSANNEDTVVRPWGGLKSKLRPAIKNIQRGNPGCSMKGGDRAEKQERGRNVACSTHFRGGGQEISLVTDLCAETKRRFDHGDHRRD